MEIQNHGLFSTFFPYMWDFWQKKNIKRYWRYTKKNEARCILGLSDEWNNRKLFRDRRIVDNYFSLYAGSGHLFIGSRVGEKECVMKF